MPGSNGLNDWEASLQRDLNAIIGAERPRNNSKQSPPTTIPSHIVQQATGVPSRDNNARSRLASSQESTQPTMSKPIVADPLKVARLERLLDAYPRDMKGMPTKIRALLQRAAAAGDDDTGVASAASLNAADKLERSIERSLYPRLHPERLGYLKPVSHDVGYYTNGSRYGLHSMRTNATTALAGQLWEKQHLDPSLDPSKRDYFRNKFITALREHKTSGPFSAALARHYVPKLNVSRINYEAWNPHNKQLHNPHEPPSIRADIDAQNGPDALARRTALYEEHKRYMKAMGLHPPYQNAFKSQAQKQAEKEQTRAKQARQKVRNENAIRKAAIAEADAQRRNRVAWQKSLMQPTPRPLAQQAARSDGERVGGGGADTRPSGRAGRESQPVFHMNGLARTVSRAALPGRSGVQYRVPAGQQSTHRGSVPPAPPPGTSSTSRLRQARANNAGR